MIEDMSETFFNKQ